MPFGFSCGTNLYIDVYIIFLYSVSAQVHHPEVSVLHLPDWLPDDLLDVVRLGGGPLLPAQPEDGPDVSPVGEAEGEVET